MKELSLDQLNGHSITDSEMNEILGGWCDHTHTIEEDGMLIIVSDHRPGSCEP